jgi:arsenite/tail-anchored protein-transporting ATPase
VIKRFIQWFRDFGIPVGGVVVNMVIQQDQVRPDSPEFVRNRAAMQDSYMNEIWRDFDGAVRAIIPLFDDEVRGVTGLTRVLPHAFATQPKGAL